MPDLLFMLAYLPQRRLADKLSISTELECTVLEIKVIEGYGCTIDVVLTQGTLHEVCCCRQLALLRSIFILFGRDCADF